MPRQSLPAELKNLSTYDVCLTQTTEEDLYKHFNTNVYEYLEMYEKNVKAYDRHIQRIYEKNPYTEYNWRNKYPTRKYEKGILSFKTEEETDIYFRYTYEIWRDLRLCNHAFGWSNQHEWVDDVLETAEKYRLDMVSLIEELKQVDARNYDTAKKEYEEKDKEWIEYKKKLNIHSSHKPKSYWIDLFRKDKYAEKLHDGVIPDNEETCEFCIQQKQADDKRREEERLEKEERQKQEEERQKRLQEEELRRQSIVIPVFQAKTYSCDPCKYSTTNSYSFETHCKSAEHKKNVWFCNHCSVQCRCQVEFDNHLQTNKHKKQAGMLNTTLHCEACNYTATLKCNYETHCKSKRHLEKMDLNK